MYIYTKVIRIQVGAQAIASAVCFEGCEHRPITLDMHKLSIYCPIRRCQRINNRF